MCGGQDEFENRPYDISDTSEEQAKKEDKKGGKKITIVKCALFITTQNGELRDECKDIWHVQTQDENSCKSSGRVARTMNYVTV